MNDLNLYEVSHEDIEDLSMLEQKEITVSIITPETTEEQWENGDMDTCQALFYLDYHWNPVLIIDGNEVSYTII